MKTVLKIFTDGGARGNPGPGAAAFIAIKDREYFEICPPGPPHRDVSNVRY